MKKDKERCSYGEFLLLIGLCVEDKQKELMGILNKQERPDFLCGRSVPRDLNAITYGQLDDLQTAANAEDPFVETCKILLGISKEEVMDEDVNDVFGFVNFVANEILRINKVFSSIKVSYSPEEREAGVEELSFGSFGVLDWYAQRMHIANQNEVRDIAWVRIFQCMKNDNERNEYERRLSKIYSKKK